jgi:glycosyltransferase involved in cell wall biosynthesis
MAGPTKVLFLNSCINGGGAGRSLDAILNVADDRVEPIVVMPDRGILAEKLEGVAELFYVPEFVERMQRSSYRWPDRIHVPWLHLPANIYGLKRSIHKITDLVREIRPDVIHCNHMLAKPIGAAVGARTGVPVVFHSRACHQMWIDGKFYDWLGRRRSVRRIICNSEASAAVYRRNSGEKVTIIPNGIDLGHYNRQSVEPGLRRGFGLTADDYVVGFVGRIQESKGIDWLLNSFAVFASNKSGARLAVVGGNDSSLRYDALEHYRRKAAALGLQDKIIFTGYQDDVRPYVMDLDVLVMPSLLPESFGRVLLEAMAFEVPVIIAAHGGAVEVVRDLEEGLWVDVNDVAGLAGAMERLYTDISLRQSIGKKGGERVRARYDRVATARQVYDVLLATAGEFNA